MLDHAKLMRALEQVAGTLFADHTHVYAIAREIWQKIAQDPTFLYKIRQITSSPWPLPFWQDKLDNVISVNSLLSPYHIISVDGSQIYPDRHQGNACFLINIGSVVLSYGTLDKPLLTCEPYVFTELEYGERTEDTVNGIRQELELFSGFDLAMRVQNNLLVDAPLLLLFDGSLIFWHLEAKDAKLRELFCINI